MCVCARLRDRESREQVTEEFPEIEHYSFTLRSIPMPEPPAADVSGGRGRRGRRRKGGKGGRGRGRGRVTNGRG